MHCAKRERRNLVRVHNDKMACLARRQYALDSALHQALSRQELAVHYQPQWYTRSRKLVGAEALLRWGSAEFGNVSPVDFIPLAESNGQIIPIGDWVLESACEQAVSWQKSGYAFERVAVNISAHQFVLPGFSQRVASILARTGLAPVNLELEITESVLASNVDLAIATLAELQHIGVQLSIDDFGTGFSSLSQLKMFSIDRLKIDRSFINGVTSDRSDQAITETILTLAHRLDLSVVAGGVETEGQLTFLRDRSCAEVQGFLLSKPLSELDIGTVFESIRAESARDESLLPRTGTDG